MGTSFERVESFTDNSNLSWRAPFIKPSVTSLSPLCKILTGNYCIHREKRTDAGNFIDILIQSYNHAILIENKIFAGTDYNPLDDYANHLSSLQQPYKCKFLLTLKPVGEDPESEIGHGFRNITYEQFVPEIRGLLGDYVAGADTRYLTFMLDFLNTFAGRYGHEPGICEISGVAFW